MLGSAAEMCHIADAKAGMINHILISHHHTTGIVGTGTDEKDIVSLPKNPIIGLPIPWIPSLSLVCAGNGQHKFKARCRFSQLENSFCCQSIKTEGSTAVKPVDSTRICSENGVPQL